MLYQVATKEDFEKFGTTDAEDNFQPYIKITTERQLSDGRYIRHIELSSEHLPEMWNDPTMKPLIKEELNMILANEPSEVI